MRCWCRRPRASVRWNSCSRWRRPGCARALSSQALRPLRQLPSAAVALASRPACAAARGAAGGVRMGHGGRGRGARAARPKKPSRQIKIDEVRAAIDWVVQTSSRGRAKVRRAASGRGDEPAGRQRAAEDAGRAARPGAVAAEQQPTPRACCRRCAAAANVCGSPPRPPSRPVRGWTEQGVRDAPCCWPRPAARRWRHAARVHRASTPRTGWPCRARGPRASRASSPAWPMPRVVDALQKLCHDAMVLASGGAPRYFATQAMPRGASLGSLAAWARSLARVARHDEHPWNDGLLRRSAGRRRPRLLARSHARGPRTRKPLDTLVR